MTLSARNWAWDVVEIQGRPIKPGEKLTLLCIAENENASYGYSFPGYAYIAQKTGQSERTVQTHVKALALAKAFTIEKARSERGRWDRSVYVLNVPEKYREQDELWMSLEGYR